jgi:hypothetical protein
MFNTVSAVGKPCITGNMGVRTRPKNVTVPSTATVALLAAVDAAAVPSAVAFVY